MSSDQTIEHEIQAKGLTAPRVTLADIEAAIDAEYFFSALDGRAGAMLGDVFHGREVPGNCDLTPLHMLTFCVLLLRNGFTVTGESACVSPKNFDVELGRKIARQNAINKVWPLLGYALKERLSHD